MRDILRIRARDSHMASFNLPALADATCFDNYGIFDLKGDVPKWLELSKVRKPEIPIPRLDDYSFYDVSFMPLPDVARIGKSTQVLRMVTGISDVLRLVRGDLVVFHVPTDSEPRPVMALALGYTGIGGACTSIPV